VFRVYDGGDWPSRRGARHRSCVIPSNLMTGKITRSDAELLTSILTARNPSALSILPRLRGSGESPLSDDELHRLCDVLTDELVAKEFDEYWTPTARGLHIENLIDKLNPFFDS
jgi:hypothetical protein